MKTAKHWDASPSWIQGFNITGIIMRTSVTPAGVTMMNINVHGEHLYAPIFFADLEISLMSVCMAVGCLVKRHLNLGINLSRCEV